MAKSYLEQLADFDRDGGKTPIDPTKIEGAEDFDPDRDPRMTDAQVSPLAALGQKKKAEEYEEPVAVAPVEGLEALAQAMQNASLHVLDTRAYIDGQAVQLTEEGYKKIRAIVIDDAIESLKAKKAMLGPPPDTKSTSLDGDPGGSAGGRKRGRPRGSKNKVK